MNREFSKDVAERVIEALEQGTAPWQRPWEPGSQRLPFNPATDKPYRGINSLWLNLQGHSDPRWMTYKQATESGAQVRRGSKGTRIEYWKFHEDRPVLDDRGAPVFGDNGKPLTRRMELERPRVFYATVFNGEQIDGLPVLAPRDRPAEPERHERAEAILAKSGAKIRHIEGGDGAYYSPATDQITMPGRSQFATADGYYATALHELGHWTGHPSRLDRDLAHPFGSAGYAREELRAELASFILGERLDIGHDPSQHVAYVGSWIKALREDHREIFRAAADAERISSFVLAFEHGLSLENKLTVDLQPLAEHVRATEQVAIFAGSELALLTGPAVDRASHERAETLIANPAFGRVLNARFNQADGTPSIGVHADGQNGVGYPDQVAAISLVGVQHGFVPGADESALKFAQAVALILSFEREGAAEAGRSEREAVDLAAELAELHAKAVPGYSPQETWQNLEDYARSKGMVARLSINPGSEAPDSVEARYLVNYSYGDGPASAVETRFFQDGKAFTSHAGQRVSSFITEDPESQRLSLGVAFDRDKPAVLQHTPEAAAMAPTRTYLAVPFTEKDAAKKAGARWDKEVKKWYAPAGQDLNKTGLARWLPSNQTQSAEPQDPPEVAFKKALEEFGLIVAGAPVMDGTIQRVPVKGDKGGKKSGAYTGHMLGRCPGGWMENKKTSERENWKYGGRLEGLSAEERAQLDRETEQRLKQRAEDLAAKQDHAAKIANALWSEAAPASADNAYCTRKGIDNPDVLGLRVVPDRVSREAHAAGVRIVKNVREMGAAREADPDCRPFMAGDLLVPLGDTNGKLWTLQTINPNFKGFTKGGRKIGLFTVAGCQPQEYAEALRADPTMPIVIAEGYATGNSVSRMAGVPVAIAFDSGNLDAVAKELEAAFPGRVKMFAADNDHRAPLENGPDGKPKPNVGLVKAREAAENNQAGVFAPPFKTADMGSDWNDFEKQYGTERASQILMVEMQQAKMEAVIAAERMITIAHDREMDARDDPRTTADDAHVILERAAAHDLMARAVSGSAEVRALARDTMAASGRNAASGIANVERIAHGMSEEVREQRENGQNAANQHHTEQEQRQVQRVQKRTINHGVSL